MCPLYFWVDPCEMYPANLSRRLGWCDLMILTLLFGSRYYVLERSIYWDALSFVKLLLALKILEYKKTFGKYLEIFVNFLVCDCYASFLDISMDLSCKRHTFCGGRACFARVAISLRGDCGGDLHDLLLWIVSSSRSDQLLLCALDFSL